MYNNGLSRFICLSRERSRGYVIGKMIDLHLHSTYSDGTCSPTELIEMASAGGLMAISITDHDTAAGTGEALQAGRKCDLRVIAGVELSVVFNDIYFHLLGYNFNWQDPRLASGLCRLQKARSRRNSQIIEKLQKMGIAVSEEELQEISGDGETGRPHIARLLVQKNVVKTIDQAFARYLKKGACCYVDRFIYRVDEAIAMLHDSGGTAVLAHPSQISRSIDQLEVLLIQLKRMGLDGLETFYPTQNGKFHRKLRSLARLHELYETGGSDYHGDIRAGTGLAGVSGHRVPAELLNQMDRYPNLQPDT
ncbi:MAG: PHP domain-containing protein [Desulfocapsaceae bacterium]